MGDDHFVQSLVLGDLDVAARRVGIVVRTPPVHSMVEPRAYTAVVGLDVRAVFGPIGVLVF